MKKIINTSKAPNAIGPYSQAIIAKDLIFTSGQIAIDPQTNEFIGKESIETQTKQVMTNLQAVLNEANIGFDQVIKTTIYLTDMAYFDKVNQIYETYFSDKPAARETVAVLQLPKNALVEISMIGILSSK